MLYRIGYDVWNPFEGSTVRSYIDVEASGGDDAAARGVVAIRGAVGERTGIKIVEIAPAPVDPEPEPEPAPKRGRPKANAAVEGEDA